MRRLSLVLFGLMTAVSQASAQDAVLSLSGDIVTQQPEKEETPAPAKAEDIAAAKSEDKGIFSFLNFLDKKKKPEVKVESGPQETVLEKLIRTAGEGDVNSQLSLGYMYLYGEDGVEVNHKKAFEYYKMAAAQNDNVAINNLGSLYFSGIGTRRNPQLAAQMFQKASELGNIEASVNLAFLYLAGQGVPKDGNAAMDLFMKASAKNNPTADFMLGYAYFRGYVMEQDLREAFELIRKAANAGYDDALFQLSEMYMNGWGTPQNYGNAVRALRKAVDQGNVDAMMALGDVLAIGEKYPRDIYYAHVLFNVASVRGAEGADEKRNVLEKKLKIEELLQAQTQAEQYVEKPSELTVYIRQTFGDNIKGYISDAVDELMKSKTPALKDKK